jgi:hypothetical protein
MTLGWMKLLRFSALLNGVFIGVGVIFLLWGATDIAFPITDRMNVAVFGLMRIILGLISLSVGVGIEAVQWAKIVDEPNKKLNTDVPTESPISPAVQPVIASEEAKTLEPDSASA